jgi:flagellar protein FliS
LTKKDSKSMYRASELDSYSPVDVETKTTAQSPHQLITMLFEKACVLLRMSIEQHKREDTEGFFNSTSHAMQIVIGLRGVLDMDNGGDLAVQLYETYTAIGASLAKARTDKDLVSIEKLYMALTELREGWETIK